MILNILRWFKHSFYTLLYRFFGLFPLQKNKIFIVNFRGRGYGDNAKYIVNALMAQGCDYEIYWSVKNLNETLPAGIKKVKYNSLKAVFHEATAHVWLDNCRKMLWVRKRKNQYYIQTWHGDIGFKKIEKDAAKGALSRSYIQDALNDSKMANLLVSGNGWFTKKIHEAFWYDGEIATCGYPRRDILYTTDRTLQKDIKTRLNIDPEAKVLLYAPTFREKAENPDFSVYRLDWAGVLSALEERFGGKWVGMVRLHPNIAQYADKLEIPEGVVNATDYPDMQELLLIGDCCISDYSSSIVDFAVTGKQGFIFATDVDAYKRDRECYFSFEEMPFPFARSNEELIQNILSFDKEEYMQSHFKFYHESLGMYEEGNAAAYIAKLIQEKCFDQSPKE